MNRRTCISVEEDIFKEFFNRLGDAKLPPKVVGALRKLWASNELESKENILKALKEGMKDATKHQEH